jgi:hypothetical protein
LVATLAVQASRFNLRISANLWEDLGDSFPDTKSVTYTFATNRNPDCGTRDTCQDVQVLNGTRPPTVSP